MIGNMVKMTFANTHTPPPLPLSSPKRGAGRRYHLAAPASAWVCLTGRQGGREGGTKGRTEGERERQREKKREIKRDRETEKETEREREED